MNSFLRGFNMGFACSLNNIFMNNMFSWNFMPCSFSVWNFNMPSVSVPMMDFSVFSCSPGTFTPMPMTSFNPTMSFTGMNYTIPQFFNYYTFTKSPQKKTAQPKTHFTANSLYEKWSKKDISKKAQLTTEFCQKVIDISEEVKCNPDDLMALMYSESRFNSTVENSYGFVGLIQFGKDARKSVGVPGNNDEERKANLKNMSALKQLDYVKTYVLRAKRVLNLGANDEITCGDLAALALRPATANQEVVINSNIADQETAYNYNKPLDLNKDGKITKTELMQRLQKYKNS